MQKSNYQTIIKKINYFFLLLFIFWLPLKDNYLPLILTLWLFTWLLEGNFGNRFLGFPDKIYFIGFLSYFLITCAQLFRSTDIDYGLFQIQEKLSLAFFPIIFFGSNFKVKKNVKIIMAVFVAGNFIASIYCLVNAFLNSLVEVNGQYEFHYYFGQTNSSSFWELIRLRYSHFSSSYLSVFIHPSYFSMFILFSILIVIEALRKSWIKKIYSKILIILLILFFVFMIYLLHSRAGLIALGVVIIIVPLIEVKKKLKKRFIFLAMTLIIAAFALLFTTPSIVKSFSSVKQLAKKESTSLSESDIRLQLWYTSIIVIKDNFWFGTSPANLTDQLVKKYNELGFEGAAKDQLNTHNQYLETYAGLGILGFLSLLYIIIYTFIISIKKRHYLLFFLMGILSINFLFESMLNRMAGVLFMMFFISLFVFAKKDNENAKLKDGLVENKY
jgi:O-antigen ligase